MPDNADSLGPSVSFTGFFCFHLLIHILCVCVCVYGVCTVAHRRHKREWDFLELELVVVMSGHVHVVNPSLLQRQ